MPLQIKGKSKGRLQKFCTVISLFLVIKIIETPLALPLSLVRYFVLSCLFQLSSQLPLVSISSWCLFQLSSQHPLVSISAEFTDFQSGYSFFRFDEKVSAREASEKCKSFGAAYSLPYARDYWDVSIQSALCTGA